MKTWALLVASAVASLATAETKFGVPFTDHAVLQRDRRIVIWGTDAPLTEVKVRIGERLAGAQASPDGRWQASFDPLPAGGPHEVTATGTTTATITNVLIGDVWLCGGQSNMEWPLKLSDEGPEAAVEAHNFPRIRLLQLPRAEAPEPQSTVDPPITWRVPDQATASEFSGVAWFFGHKLSTELGVPIGLVQVAWGGTRIEPWISPAGFSKAPTLRDIYRNQLSQIRQLPSEMRRWEEREALWKATAVHDDPGRDPATEGWESPDLPGDGWEPVTIPLKWSDAGHPMNGAGWFRLVVDIPETWKHADLELNLGPIDDMDDTWFNGQRIGGMNDPANQFSWAVKRRYTIPSESIRPGRNVITIRVWDRTGDGGLMGSLEDYFVRHPLTDRTIPLDAQASFRVENAIPLPDINYFELVARFRPAFADPATHPSRLNNGMIAPLTPMAVRGVIWYQGESNASKARDYTRLLPALIVDWRRLFKNSDMQFLYVQLANFGAATADNGKSNWAELREAQRSALSVPGTGMVVTIDIGNPGDIHPRNKRTVGERLADQALVKHYGIEENGGICEGPLAVGASREGTSARIWFTSVGGGLKLRECSPRTFEVAGPDNIFQPAVAVVTGETVVVSSPKVKEISAVQYGWADAPDAALFNAEGYPGSPFRLTIMKE